VRQDPKINEIFHKHGHKVVPHDSDAQLYPDSWSSLHKHPHIKLGNNGLDAICGKRLAIYSIVEASRTKQLVAPEESAYGFRHNRPVVQANHPFPPNGRKYYEIKIMHDAEEKYLIQGYKYLLRGSLKLSPFDIG
jgi:hypothetical protein